MLSVERLDVAYGGSQVVWSVDLDVPDGQVVCLMGRNGVGKTTVLRAIMGLLPARSGRITLDGQDITRWPSDRRARAGLGYVPQGREVFPHLSVEENLRMALLGCERATSIDDALDLRRSGASSAARAACCRAASSRCWPSAARCSRGPSS